MVLVGGDVGWDGSTEGKDEKLVCGDVLGHLDDELLGRVRFEPVVDSLDLWLYGNGAVGQSLVNLLEHVNEGGHGGLDVELIPLGQVVDDRENLSRDVSTVLEAVIDGDEVVLSSETLDETGHEEDGI